MQQNLNTVGSPQECQKTKKKKEELLKNFNNLYRWLEEYSSCTLHKSWKINMSEKTGEEQEKKWERKITNSRRRVMDWWSKEKDGGFLRDGELEAQEQRRSSDHQAKVSDARSLQRQRFYNLIVTRFHHPMHILFENKVSAFLFSWWEGSTVYKVSGNLCLSQNSLLHSFLLCSAPLSNTPLYMLSFS